MALYVLDDYVATDYFQTGITVDWGTKTIFVPTQAMVLIQTVPSTIYQLDMEAFRLALKDLEDDEDGIMFPDTHSRNAPVTVSGAVLAQVIEIINGYTVTFEEIADPYRVNAVGANSNIGEVHNVNSVSLSTSNSAGLQDLNSLQAASFGGEVTVDVTSSFTGETFPVGTRSNPVNNLTDAFAIANTRGISTFTLMNDTTLTSNDFSAGYIFQGINPSTATVTIEAGAEVSNCTFRNLTVQGVLDNFNILRECYVMDISHNNGFVYQCAIAGTVTLGGGVQATFLSCYSGIAGGSTPTIDMGGTGQELILRDYHGGVKLTNRTGTDLVSIDISSGQIILDATVSAGDHILRGHALLTNNSTGTATVDAKGLIQKTGITTAQFIALK